MPINKPTIAHQLKTVKITKPKSSSVIHTNQNIIATTPHTRSHLRGGGPQWKKSTYDRRDDIIDAGDISHSELKQCTRILRNVLANEVLTQNLSRDRKNKSTSTDDCIPEDRFVNPRFVDFKSSDFTDGTSPEKYNDPAYKLDEETEAESLTSIVEHKSILTKKPSVPPNYCHCQIDINNNNQMHDARKLTGSGDCARNSGDKSSICARCHNVIPPVTNAEKDDFLNKNSDPQSGYDRYTDKYVQKSFASNPGGNEYMTPVHYDNIGDDKIDSLVGLLQVKVNEIGLIARATRDADLDRLVSEIDRAFQQMIRENALIFNHLKTITKTLKWENSGLKQKIKSQIETIRDLKSETKLLRQDHKQKFEELKLELESKEEEVRQVAEKDKSSMSHWREKFHSLEKDHEKLRCEYQGQMLVACQKDTEIIQLKHTCTQSESKLKEHIHSLMLSQQNLQTELSKAQEIMKKYDQECHHNQSIIKSAREHVISLLERHKTNNVDVSSSIGYQFDSLCGDTPQNGSGDWINQATSLQQVLSMVSDGRSVADVGHKLPSNENGHYFSGSSRPFDPSRSMTVSPINFATTNYNNNYISSSTCNQNSLDSSKRLPDSDLRQVNYSSQYQNDQSASRSPSDVSSTVSNLSFCYSQRNSIGNIRNNIDERNTDHFVDRIGSNMTLVNDSWNLDNLKPKMSSASSVMSTVSSLRSTDDHEFRSGLQRLDSQISRLQSTLQSKLQCK